MLKSFELIVEGQVQRVGFRNFVSRIAFELNIKGEIQNISGEKVRILVQGEQENLSEFIKRIWVTEWPIDVWNISKKETKSLEQFDRFKIIRGKIQEEISERMDEAAFFLQKLNKDMNENFGRLFNETHEHKKLTEKFLEDSNLNFNKLDSKYGMISEQLEKANKKLDKLDKLDEIGDSLGAMKDSMQRLEKKM